MGALGRRRKFPSWVLGLAGLLMGLLAAASLAAPKVLSLSPSPGAQGVPATAAIRISFSRPMDPSSVDSRVSMSLQHPVESRWEDDTLVLAPRRPWPQGTRVTVRLAAGARSRRFLPLLAAHSWSFSVGAPRLVYLWPSDGPADLYAQSIDQDTPTRLTQTPRGVIDYSVGSKGTMIVYSAEQEAGGSSLWLLDLVSGSNELAFTCPEGARCQAPSLSPDGQWLTFEQYELVSAAAGHLVRGPSRVWVLQLESDMEPMAIGEPDHVTSQPRWTPSGWLAYYDHTLRAMALMLDTLSPDSLPFSLIVNELGSMATWSPDGAYLIFPEVVFPTQVEGANEGAQGAEDPEFFSHLYRVEVASGLAADLSGERAGLVEDASPAYSPDGQWIAFARKHLDRERWTPGRQLWLMRPDGREARQLTNAPDYNHSALAWSPDSTSLAYMRFNQVEFTQPAEIWWIDINEAQPRMLVEGGYLPQWIP